MIVMTKNLVLAVAAALSLVAIAAAQDDAASMLRTGRKQEAQAVGKKGEERAEVLRKALDIYRQIPQRWPDASVAVADAWLRTAVVHKRLGDADQALAALDSALVIEGATRQHVRALETKAVILKKAKKLDDAKAALRRIVDDYPSETRDVARACLSLASIARRQKNWREAISWGERVLDKHQDLWRENVAACDLLCGVLIRCHQWVKAIDKLGELDQLLEGRFSSHEKWASVRKAMDRMTSRRQLTPVPVSDNG